MGWYRDGTGKWPHLDAFKNGPERDSIQLNSVTDESNDDDRARRRKIDKETVN